MKKLLMALMLSLSCAVSAQAAQTDPPQPGEVAQKIKEAAEEAEEKEKEREREEVRTKELLEKYPEYIDGSLGIMGASRISEEQMLSYLQSVYPDAPEEVKQLPGLYLEEGRKEGVRGDVAFAQAVLETGHFEYEGSAVTPDQHNYCGLGVTRNGMKGESFPTAREGVRAQIQHLKAYASTEPLNGECIDPRFELVTRGIAPSLDSLSRRWAVGDEYGDHIEELMEKIASY